MVEAGVPDYEVTTFNGIPAPAGTPAAIVKKLNAAMNEALATAEIQAIIAKLGAVSPLGRRNNSPSSLPRRSPSGGCREGVEHQDRLNFCFPHPHHILSEDTMRLALRAGAIPDRLHHGRVVRCRPAAAVDPLNPSAPCSVFDAPPARRLSAAYSAPGPVCRRLPSLGQGLRLTIHSHGTESPRAPEGPVNSLSELFAALRACWEPPPLEEAFHGMQMSVRFSFKRTGEPVAAPRVTYASSEAAADGEGHLPARRRCRARALHADAVQQGNGRRDRRPPSLDSLH